MKRIFFFISIVLLQVGIAVAKSGDDSIIRVRMLAQQKQLEIEGEGIAFNGKEETIKGVSIPRFSKWNLSSKKINGRHMWQASMSSPGTQTLFFNMQKSLVISGRNLKTGPNEWQGILVLVNAGQSHFDLIAYMPQRNYLIGVLDGEMPKDWPLETLKAQAVAARSYVESVRLERKKMSFDVEADHRDQVYSSKVSKDFKQTSSLQERAVFETKSVILTTNQKTLKAYFHSDCGGEPASAASVWGREKKNDRAPSSCYYRRQTNWNYKVAALDMFKKIKSVLPSFDEKYFLSFRWVHLPGQQRISEVKMIMANGKNFQLRSQEFREALGYGNLKSTLFEVQKQGDAYVFTGKGFGHGVGLCQHGAFAMAQAGKTYQQILNHYYPQAQLAYQKAQELPSASRSLSSSEL